MVKKTLEKFVTFGELATEVIDYRSKIDVNSVCKYGIDMLDDFLGGIGSNELVVIGADTGVGKSELAYKIAIHNAVIGKKVMLFGLEGDVYEPVYRYFQEKINQEEDDKDIISNVEYRFNTRPEATDREIVEYGKIDMNLMNNLLIYKKTKTPEVEEIREHIENAKKSVDLIVIDHLHYIDYGNQNENFAISGIMRQLKEITDIHRKPIVLISHLRKREMKSKKGDNVLIDPTLDDLHGSSNIKKEATTAILITPMDKHNIEKLAWGNTIYRENDRYAGTKMIIAKSRIGLPKTDLAMLYDRYKKSYLKEYSELMMSSKSSYRDALSYKKHLDG